MTLTCIHKDQVEDFARLLASAGKDAKYFVITDSPDPIPTGRIVEECGKVTVTHRSNGIARTYAVGLQSRWWSAAADDVNSGKFDE
jgi:hypothetical protein